MRSGGVDASAAPGRHAQEPNTRLDLWAHVTCGELPIGQVVASFLYRHAIQPHLIRPGQVQCYDVNTGGDQQKISVDASSEQSARIVLVDHFLYPDQPSVRLHDRDAPSTRRNHHHSPLHQRIDGIDLHDAAGDWRRHYSAPSSPSIFCYRPTLCTVTESSIAGKKGTDVFGGFVKSRVVTIDQYLSHHCNRLFGDPTSSELVVHCSLNHIANRA